MLLRRVARPLLAITFITDGVDTLLHPEERAKAAETWSTKAGPVLPDAAAATLRANAGVAVRVNAAVQVAAGAALALGKAPRAGSLLLALTVLPATLVGQDFWAEQEPGLRAAKRAAFVKDVSLLGGLLIAAADTEGKPSLGWWGRREARRAAAALPGLRQVEATGLDTARAGWQEATQHGRELADLLVETGTRLAESAYSHGDEVAGVLRRRGGDLTDTARKQGAELLQSAAHRSADVAAAVRDRGARLADRARTELDADSDRGRSLARKVSAIIS